MRRFTRAFGSWGRAVLFLTLFSGCGKMPQSDGTSQSGNADVTATIIAVERATLDRWGKGDPQGFLEVYAPDVTYFDPFQDKRIDGHDAMTKLLLPFERTSEKMFRGCWLNSSKESPEKAGPRSASGSSAPKSGNLCPVGQRTRSSASLNLMPGIPPA